MAEDLLSLPLESLLQVEYEVSSASKFTQVASRAPTSVLVVDAEAIRRHGWRTLTELFNSLPGMLFSSDRGYDHVGIRGFQHSRDFNNRCLLAIDGQRVNDPVYEQAMVGDEFPLDLSMVERVEFVAGPGSSVYGANAMFGTINVITKRAATLGKGATLSTSTDGWRTANGHVATTLENGSSLTLAVTTGEKSGRDVQYSAPPGYLTLPNGVGVTSGMAVGLDRTQLARVFARWEGNDSDLTLIHGTRNHQPSAPLYGTLLNDPTFRLEDSNSKLSFSLHRELSTDLEFRGHVSYSQMRYVGDYPYWNPAIGHFINQDQTAVRWWSGEGYTVYSGLSDHKIVGGVNFQHATQARQLNLDILPGSTSTLLNVDTAANTLGLYVQDEWTFAPDWLTNLGVRYDHHSTHGGSLSPRLALVRQTGPGSSLKLLASSAYRNPSDFEAYYASPPWLSNPALQRESIRTYQLVAEQRLSDHLNAAASLFRYDLSNQINQVISPNWQLQYQNVGRVSAEGGDISLTHRGEQGEQLMTSLALQSVKTDSGWMQRLDNSPRWIAKLNASQPIAGAWILAGEARVVGPRTSVWTDGVARRLPTEPIVDLTLTAPRGGLTGQLRITNVFNYRGNAAASMADMTPLIPLFGRTLWLTIGYVE